MVTYGYVGVAKVIRKKQGREKLHSKNTQVLRVSVQLLVTSETSPIGWGSVHIGIPSVSSQISLMSLGETSGGAITIFQPK